MYIDDVMSQGPLAESSILNIMKIAFKAGESPRSSDQLEVTPGPVLVLVGPNNSGKSLALREIENWCFGAATTESRSVVASVVLNLPTDAETAMKLIERFRVPPLPTDNFRPGEFRIAQFQFRTNQVVSVTLGEAAFDSFIKGNERDLRFYSAGWNTIRLDGRTRFSLVNDQPTSDLLQMPPSNHLAALFLNDEARKKVQELTYEAFKLYFVIDPTPMTQFRIRMSEQSPNNSSREQALDKSSREFFSAARPITQFSDGIQAFVGVVSAIMSLDHKIILIDEPEAFLFPPLARRLGSALAEITKEKSASLVVATHSAEFLIGCLEKLALSVVRLTYLNNVATARKLESDQLKGIMQDPLLRSTKVLDALFHQAVVITEGDTDRAFYNEINRRLQGAKRGMEDTLFLNAQNWQTVHKINMPLRRIGVPAAAIVDMDLLEETGVNWTNLLSSALIPLDLVSKLSEERAAVVANLPIAVEGEMRPIKNDGLEAFTGESRKRAEDLLTKLAKFGLFVVPVGQVENWLKPLGVVGHGPKWLVEMFTRLGLDDALGYVHPANDDVWRFLDRISEWTNDVKRLGT